MLVAERLLSDVEGTLIERLGLGVSPLRSIESRQAVEAVRRAWVLGAERLLIDVEGAPKERLGLGVPPLRFVEFCQIVEEGRRVRMSRAESRLEDVESALIERLGLGILRALVQVIACSIHQSGSFREIDAVLINERRK